MRSQTKMILLALSACSLSCLFVQPATAKLKPPPPTGNPGPVGALNTLGATAGLQDKSPMSATLGPTHGFMKTEGFTNQYGLYAPRTMKVDLTQLLRLDGTKLLDLIHELNFAIRHLKPRVRPENLLYVEMQARTPSPTYYIPGALLSNGRLGLDVGAQAYFGPQEGYGITLRKDIQSGHLNLAKQSYTYNDFVYSAEELKTELTAFVPLLIGNNYTLGKVLSISAKNTLQEVADNYSKNRKHIEEIEENTQITQSLAAQFVHLSTEPQSAFVYGYRFFQGSGDIQFAGISLARLIPLHSNPLTSGVRVSPSDGLQILLNVQGLFFSPTVAPNLNVQNPFSPPVSSPNTHHQWAVRTGVALAWQNRIPYVEEKQIIKDGKQTKISEALGRWRWQGGVEYRFPNSLEHDLIGGFIRYRFLSGNRQLLSGKPLFSLANNTNKKPNKFHGLEDVEITASLGKGTDDRFYFGLSVGKIFTF